MSVNTKLDRVREAAKNRKQANREFVKACKEARAFHSLRELSEAAGLTRERIRQITTTS